MTGDPIHSSTFIFGDESCYDKAVAKFGVIGVMYKIRDDNGRLCARVRTDKERSAQCFIDAVGDDCELHELQMQGYTKVFPSGKVITTFVPVGSELA